MSHLSSPCRYVTEHRAHRLLRPLALHRWWVRHCDLRLAPARLDQGNLPHYNLVLERSLLELGIIPKAQIPTKTKGTVFYNKKMCNKYDRMVCKVPPNPTLPAGSRGTTRGEDRRSRAGVGNQAVQEEESKADKQTTETG